MYRPSCGPSLEKTARVGYRARYLLKIILLSRGHTTTLGNDLLVSPWGPQFPLGCAVVDPVTLLPAIPETAAQFQIARVSTPSLSVAPYYSCFCLLRTARSRDSTFHTRLNVAELIGLLNSPPSLRRFSRDRLYEIRVLLDAPFHVEGTRPRHQLHRDDIFAGSLINLPQEFRNTRSMLALTLLSIVGVGKERRRLIGSW